jgi:hypothetical protein
MKKVILLFAAMLLCTMAANAQRVIDLADVTNFGSNCDFNDETLTATYQGPYNRWFDLPDISGDISKTPNLTIEVLESNVILRVCILYRGDDPKPTQVDVTTFYGQMGKEITSPKELKLNLIKNSNGNVSKDMLENLVAIRITMAKQCDGAKEPWHTKFGKVTLY